MDNLASHEIWRQRLDEIDNPIQHLHIPKDLDDEPDQDEEWCEIITNDRKQRIRFHDYDEVFEIPGLYETLFYDTLECCSPSYVVRLLQSVAKEWDAELSSLKVLDVGAGNGMVGDELRHRGVGTVVGVDIIKEAKDAALRDRPGIYADYRIADLTRLPEADEQSLRRHGFTCLTTVAALGYGDIPPQAFLKALDLINPPGWLAFNIKEDFLHESDRSGFSQLIRQLMQQGYIQPQCYRRYRHRLSIGGEPLYYIAMIATKCRPVPPALFAD